MELLNIAKTRNLINSIARTVAKLDDNIHLAGCSALFHYADNNCGDATLLTRLVKATSSYNKETGQFDGRSVRGAALRHWITSNANVKWDKKAYGKEGGYIKKEKGNDATVNLERAMAVPFYAMTEDKVQSEYLDWFKRTTNLMNSLASALKNDRIKEDERGNVSVIINSLDKLLKERKSIVVKDDDDSMDDYVADDLDHELMAQFEIMENDLDDDLEELKVA